MFSLGSRFFQSILGLGLLLLGACAPEPERATLDYDLAKVTAVAKEALIGVQTRSFRENREYCGLIGIDPSGEVRAADPTRGRSWLCVPLNIPNDWKIIASYHTHGAFTPQGQQETPSVQDMKSAIEFEVIGFLATPGGRFWSYGGQAQTAQLICGPGCLAQDPLYYSRGPVKDKYTFDEVKAIEEASKEERS